MTSSAVEHEHFEEMAALAAVGCLSPNEFAQFVGHVSDCTQCQAQYGDMVEMFRTGMPCLISGEESFQEMAFSPKREKRVRAQFLERARREGFPLGVEENSWVAAWQKWKVVLHPPQAYAYAIALMALIAAVAFGNALRISREENQTLLARLASSNEPPRKTGQIEQKAAQENVVYPNESPDKSALRAEAVMYSTLLAQFGTLQQKLHEATDRLHSMEGQIAADQINESDLSKRLSDASADLSTKDTDLQNAREVHARDLASLKQQQADLDALQEKVAAANVALERERDLMAADRDIRDLMGARGLHITDIYDVDDRGRTRQATGRVFYTEGKSLIVYAFDLMKPGVEEAKHTFQAWGYREANKGSARSLGIFYMDDKKQNRWVLKFENPEVLNAIDTVFVTMEPSGGSGKPTGHQLLYAYLNSAPNHP